MLFRSHDSLLRACLVRRNEGIERQLDRLADRADGIGRTIRAHRPVPATVPAPQSRRRATRDCGPASGPDNLQTSRRKLSSLIRELADAAKPTLHEAKGAKAWKPVSRERDVSPALRAYAAMSTSAAKGAVRDVSQIEKK